MAVFKWSNASSVAGVHLNAFLFWEKSVNGAAVSAKCGTYSRTQLVSPKKLWSCFLVLCAATNNVEFRNEDTDFTLTNTILLTVKITVQTSNL
jgi:hypothetical protein